MVLDKKELLGWAVLEHHPEQLMIDWIVVKEQYSNQGIETQLIEKTISVDRKNKARIISVSAGSKNKKRETCYHENGSKKVGEVKNCFKLDKKHLYFAYSINA